LVVAVGGAAVGVLLYVLGGARPQTPDLEGFIEGESPAWYSPPLFGAVRRRSVRARFAEDPART
jgi:hypothetical protein